MFSCNHRKARWLGIAIAVLVLLGGCEQDSVFEPTDTDDALVEPSEHLVRAHNGGAVLMTRNLFVGAPVEMIYAPDVDVFQAAADLWEWVGSTDFDERADAIADEIAEARPHAVGLQEVSVFLIFTDFDPVTQSFNPQPVHVLNFLEVLLGKLQARGLYYVPASNSENFQGAVPMYDSGSNTGLSLVSLADFDFIIVRDDVAANATNPQHGNFDRILEVGLLGQTLEIARGWASIDLTVNNLDFRFVTTHLEPQNPDPTIQVDQGYELIEVLTNWALPGDPTLPTIVSGDMNSAADGSDTPTYGNFIDAEFVDAWGPRRRGYTCCQPEHLRNRRPELDRRVDVILLRGDFGHLLPLRTAVFAWRVGHRVRDKTHSGLWPSDHAGVVAAMRPPRPLAAR